ncbi:protein translocase subunit secG [Loktanella atrilutea]|uniref:Protein-export membrane protein SecG n=1 Tax=Loktanella atrilutea TaxID=366533 RepID=A0A1M5A4H9_LOKAT|nr:preprotein translocase subunit SecG [Loktanella atrilutea]SHF25219.1 protein translocase subunit secG [Loktanella atrilutea]
MQYENVVLVIHLILALTLIGTVLLQRSEGGGLGMGGSGGATGSRPAPTAMGKVTWILALCFIATSIALTIIAAENAAGASVVDRLQDAPVSEPAAPATPGLGNDLLPPPANDASLTPGATDAAPAATAPADATVPAPDAAAPDTTPDAPAAETPATEAPAATAPANTAPTEAAPANTAPAATAPSDTAPADAAPADAAPAADAPAAGDTAPAPAGN